MNGPNMLGLAGALLAGYAYIPQITHLIKERCTAGLSRSAFSLWLISSVLVTINAIFIESVVFIILGSVQIVSTGIIFAFTTRYRDQICEYHQSTPLSGTKNLR
jgi:uncharacterized protein with PQ loop repeat